MPSREPTWSTSPHRRLPATLAALLAAASAACTSEDVIPAVPVPDPLESEVTTDGPFAAGYRTLEATYESPGGLGERTLTLNLWYPTEEPGGPTPVYSKLFVDDDVFVDAPLARPAYADGFPVLVHSHGFRGYGGNSAELMRHFATHGWVVVAPDHKDNTLLDALDPLPLSHYFHRPLDIRASLDALATLPTSDPLAAGVDLGRVAMSGHSFGTFTTWASAGATFDRASIEAACESGGKLADAGCTDALVDVFETDLSEPRVRAAIPMAGGARPDFFANDGYDSAGVPVLLMTGSDDSVDGKALFDQVGAELDFTWIDVEGGCHQLFGFGDCTKIANEVGFPIVKGFALAFARHHVLGDDDPRVAAIVDGTDTLSELVSLEKK